MKRSGVNREEIYLVTKLWPSVYADADNAIGATLKRLDTDYIDPLFLHQSAGDYVGAYKAMGTAVMAWYPLGHGDKSLVEKPIFTKLEEKYGKSNAQIILR